MVSRLLQLSFLLGLVSSTWWTTATALNITLNATALDSLSDLSSAIGSRVYVICEPGQLDYSLFVTESQTDVDNCATSGSYISVGSCVNSPLLVRIQTLSISLPNIQSYEVGTEYYFIVFQTNNGVITSNQPCLDGLKFSFSVVDVPDPVGSLSSSSVVMVQSSNVPVVSSSIDAYDNPISSPSYELSSTLSAVSSSSGLSMVPSRGSASITSSGVQRESTSTTTAARRSTTTTTRPGITPNTGRIGTDEIEVTTYAGIGGALFLIIAVAILVIVLIVVAVFVSRRRKRNLGRNSVIYDEACESQKNSTLKRMVSIDEDDDQKNGGYQLTERPLTFQPNGNGNIAVHGNISYSPTVSSTEEESLRSTTSMDPLLTSSPPNSPIRPNPSPSTLEAIPEGSGLDNSNNDHTYTTIDDHLDTKVDLGNDNYGNNVPQQSNSNVHNYEGIDNDNVLQRL